MKEMIDAFDWARKAAPHIEDKPDYPSGGLKEAKKFKDRIFRVGGDYKELHMPGGFYDDLLKRLGPEETLKPRRAVNAVRKAIAKYEEKSRKTGFERPSFDLRSRAKEFIEAIFFDNKEQQAEAWKLWEKLYPENEKDNK